MMHIRALCSCGHAHALHASKRPHRCMVVRGKACACTGYRASVDCRLCGNGTGICAACEAEIGHLLPVPPRDAEGLWPL